MFPRVLQTNFIQQKLPPGSQTGADVKQAGALGLGQRASTGIGTFNTFWVYIIPLFGAYIADTRWGRFKTTCIAVAIALVGHVLLIISAVPGVINHSHGSLACFLVAIIIMGVGTGGFKANVSPLVAEQYKRTKLFIGHTKSGERVIVDPLMTTSRIYMYFYLFINVGALIGQISMAYSEKVRSFISQMLEDVFIESHSTLDSGFRTPFRRWSLGSAPSCCTSVAICTSPRPLRAPFSASLSDYGGSRRRAVGHGTPCGLSVT